MAQHGFHSRSHSGHQFSKTLSVRSKGEPPWVLDLIQHAEFDSAGAATSRSTTPGASDLSDDSIALRSFRLTNARCIGPSSLAVDLQPHPPPPALLRAALEHKVDAAHLREALLHARLLKVRAEARERAVREQRALPLSVRVRLGKVVRAVEVVVPRELERAREVEASGRGRGGVASRVNGWDLGISSNCTDNEQASDAYALISV
ncbi:hypothetical protein NUW54_g9154 [Trametes sanguinea]|uniref:Uncharacterized protein n=1 Tax=Trametes sanguinea TaxID=158606 RepID=A0ACC1P9N5_9APHY|nr:hypothetical protein NUW54_g9154 [Trametes sanguinea]